MDGLFVRQKKNTNVKIWFTLGFVGLLIIYHLIGHYFGTTGKVWALVATVFLSAGMSIAIWLLRRRLKRDLQHMNLNQRAIILEELPELTERKTFEHGWEFKLVDGAIGILCALLPPFFVTILRDDPLSWEADFTGYHLLAMAGGVSIYMIGRHLRVLRLRQRDSLQMENKKETNIQGEQISGGNGVGSA